MTGAPDGFAIDAGETRFRVAVGPLDHRRWTLLQNRLMAHAKGKRGVRGAALAVLGGALIGGLLGGLAGHAQFEAWLVLTSERYAWAETLEGVALIVLVTGLIVLTLAAAALLVHRHRLGVMRRFFGASTALGMPSEIVLAENGVVRRDAGGVGFVRWGAVTELFAAEGLWFLIVDNTAALWLDEAAFGEERAAAEVFIRSKIAADRPAA